MITYSDKPWLGKYDKGVSEVVEVPDQPLYAFMSNHAAQNPNQTALITSAALPVLGRLSSELTYGELDKQSDALAAALIDLGVKKGDRVAMVMPNTTAFVISFFGILKAGGVVAATNPTYPPEKMAQQINYCEAEVVICLSMFYDAIKSVQVKTKVKTVIVANIKEYLPTLARILFTIAREKKDGHYVESLKSGDHWFQDLLGKFAGRAPKVDVRGDDLCIFQYTGGTTGTSKAAMSTHHALVANTLQQSAFLTVDGVPGNEELMLGAIPLFHVFGMVAVLSVGMSIGTRIILVPNARDIDDVLGVIDKFQPTLFHGVPALYNAINNHPDVTSGKTSLRSIRLCVSGSAPLPPSTKREFERLSGGILLEGYGMSEMPTATHVNPVHGENRTGSIGIPLPNIEVRIVSLDDGETVLPVGEAGEIIMHGPNLMKGYFGMPTETSNALRELEGKTWLYTGDIARMDEDGYFYIVDRKKDMALIGGFNVYPTTIENTLKEHPAVLEVGVAAIPHPEKVGQEALKAWIVLREDQKVTEAELIAHCEKHLAKYEVPRRFAFIDELPKTAVGKTLRRELVQQEIAEIEKAK